MLGGIRGLLEKVPLVIFATLVKITSAIPVIAHIRLNAEGPVPRLKPHVKEKARMIATDTKGPKEKNQRVAGQKVFAVYFVVVAGASVSFCPCLA
jgi:hypothetical protein